MKGSGIMSCEILGRTRIWRDNILEDIADDEYYGRCSLDNGYSYYDEDLYDEAFSFESSYNEETWRTCIFRPDGLIYPD